MKYLLITAAIALAATTTTPVWGQATKTRKMQDSTRQTAPRDNTRKSRPLNKGLDSAAMHPHDSIPGKNVNGR
jgi:hypothetical protein